MTGDQSDARALVSTPDNQMLTPKTLADKIEDLMMTGGRIINLCSLINIKGLTEYPVVTSKSDPEQHKETGASNADPAAKKEKTIGVASVTLEPQFIAETLRTTRKFEADSLDAFWTWLMAELPDALRRVIDTKILSGAQAATDGLHGILTNTNTGGAPFVATLADHELNFNTANQALALLDDGIDDDITFVMNRRTFYNNVMGLKDLSDRPIYTISTDNETKGRAMIGGYPVVFSSALKDYDTAAAGDPYIVAGNFKAYTLNFPLGYNVNIVRDAVTNMEKNIVRYLSEIYVAGNVTKVGAFVKVTKQA
jgi:HK97 family phage major capsid protein